MTDRVTASYGAWPSPIAANDVTRGERRLGFPSVVGERIWWEESRPDEDGRNTIMRRDSDGSVAELLASPWNARTRVHEYGGRSYVPVPRQDGVDGARPGIVFANLDDQRLYFLAEGGNTPQPLTPEPSVDAALRYADMTLTSDGGHVICVREQHGSEDGPSRAIVSVPLSGAVDTPEAIRELVTDADFFASPVPSPDGQYLAWISWNHPRMPWDGTELRAGTLTESGVTGTYTLKGGLGESVLAPMWQDESSLLFLSDWPGWWNLYQIGLTGPAFALYPAEKEFCGGFTLGMQPYQLLNDGRVVTLYGHADLSVGVYDPKNAALEDVSTPLTSWRALASNQKNTVVGVAAAADTPQRLVQLDPDTGHTQTLRRAQDDLPDSNYVPEPRTVSVNGRYGGAVHANVYPPTNPAATGTGPAPYIVWVHGGPVGCANTELDLAKAYFTSRGLGIVDVNYSGSIGYGRTYRERLQRQWGVIDVEDAISVVQSLVDDGIADPQRLAIRGASAGGFTTLRALTWDTFACGVSVFGVTDLARLSEETHDFESRFLDSLIGPLPGYEATYRERSPINQAENIQAPVLLLQGTQDPVVPPPQATEFANALAEQGVSHAHLEFGGEGHGFRAAESQQRALEAELAFYGKIFGFAPAGVPELELVPGGNQESTSETQDAAEAADEEE